MKVLMEGRKKLFGSKEKFVQWQQNQNMHLQPEEIWEFVASLSEDEGLILIPQWLCAAKHREEGKKVFPVSVATIKRDTEKAILIEEIEVAELSSDQSLKNHPTKPKFGSVWLPKSQIAIYQSW